MILEKADTWKKWTPDGMTFLSAVFIVLSFPPWNFWPLIWISLIPWLTTLRKKSSTQEAVIQGIWLSYFMTMGGFYWVAFVLREFGGLPWILSILGLQVFAIFGQPQFFLFAAAFHYLDNDRTLKTQTETSRLYRNTSGDLFKLFLFSFIYTGIDWILPKLFIDTFGHSLYRAQNLRQLADLGGATLLTFLIYLVNHCVWNLKNSWMNTKRIQISFQLTSVLFICLLAWLYGYFRHDYVIQKINQSHLGIQAAAIQGNIGDFDKLAAERGVRGAAYKVIDTFIQLSDQAMQLKNTPEVVIWPETSYPSTFRNPHSLTEISLDQQIETYAQKLGIPLLFGGYDKSDQKEYNAFFFLSPKGDLQIYRKNILLLFGEYIPGAESITWLRDTFPQIGNFGRGVGPEVFSLPLIGKKEIRVSPIICYEALFSEYVAEAARKGSQMILNITNDSWFGEWGEPQLHLALTTFRSIETRLPQLRSTNTGVSALITADGEITNPTGIGTQEIMNVYVPITDPIPTLVKSWGNWFGPLSLLLACFGLVLNRLGRSIIPVKKS